MKALLAQLLSMFRSPEPNKVEELPWLDTAQLPEKRVRAKKKPAAKKATVRKPAVKKPAAKKPAAKTAKKAKK